MLPQHGPGWGELRTWFFTSVTQPFSRQSTVSGMLPPGCHWYMEDRLCPWGTFSPVSRADTSSLV